MVFSRAVTFTLLVAGATGAQGLGAQSPERDRRATVAILYFTNSALVRHQEYQPLSKGIAEMLITELSASPALQVVERSQLQSLLDEQNLGTSGRVDQETAVRIGKLLGAKHLLMGGFVIDTRGKLRLDLRAVDTETSQVVYVETVSGKAEEVLDLIADLGKRVSTRLKLPPLRSAGAAGGEPDLQGGSTQGRHAAQPCARRAG